MSGAVSSDRRWLMDGRSRIVNDRGQYVTDGTGAVISFATAGEAQAWLDGFCEESGVPRGHCSGCMESTMEGGA